ncbi:MAG: regulatory particle non-ATPase [Pycnora praestabilis]|nr:MAG: regulatory particle non-ATPase [Pycnora praestabilis]
MSDKDLSSLLQQLHQTLSTHDYQKSSTLLSRAKLALLSLNALVPTSQTSQKTLALSRETLELGALISIRQQDPSSFTRYFQQLQPFYDLPSTQLPHEGSNQSKITGLYLLLLLSQGDYAGFHTVLESLEVASASALEEGKKGAKGLEEDVFIQYPVKLEQWLMEGAYDRVWGATKEERVPSEEYDVFSDVLVGTIRSEIASCSEKAYPSLPISNAKNLLFLDSEGSVVEFAQARGWMVRDGRIYFPLQQDQGVGTEKEILATSGQVIENTIGYARELEMIV